MAQDLLIRAGPQAWDEFLPRIPRKLPQRVDMLTLPERTRTEPAEIEAEPAEPFPFAALARLRRTSSY